MLRKLTPCTCVVIPKTQTARKIHVAKFRAKKVPVLITTDVAARGIDIPLIDNVVNFDFPPKPELFVHRCVWDPLQHAQLHTSYLLVMFAEQQAKPPQLLTRPQRLNPPGPVVPRAWGALVPPSPLYCGRSCRTSWTSTCTSAAPSCRRPRRQMPRRSRRRARRASGWGRTVGFLREGTVCGFGALFCPVHCGCGLSC